MVIVNIILSQEIGKCYLLVIALSIIATFHFLLIDNLGKILRGIGFGNKAEIIKMILQFTVFFIALCVVLLFISEEWKQFKARTPPASIVQQTPPKKPGEGNSTGVPPEIEPNRGKRKNPPVSPVEPEPPVMNSQPKKGFFEKKEFWGKK